MRRQIGSATLILGDAFIEMPKLGEVDSIIPDPPYNPKTHKGALVFTKMAVTYKVGSATRHFTQSLEL